MYLVSHYAGEQIDGLEQMRVLSSLVRIIGSLGGVGSRNSLLSIRNLFSLKEGRPLRHISILNISNGA